MTQANIEAVIEIADFKISAVEFSNNQSEVEIE